MRRIVFCVALLAALILPAYLDAVHAQGKAAVDVYLDKCAVCHGEDGAGKTSKGKKLKVKNVRETVAKQTVAQMIEIVIKGKDPDMEGYGKELTPDQIRQVVDYYRALAATKK